MIVLVPDARPVTVPSVPMDAFVPALLLHAPPDVVSLSNKLEPTHTAAGVLRIAVIGFTVTVMPLAQPEPVTV